jgi:hypothetical protein
MDGTSRTNNPLRKRRIYMPTDSQVKSLGHSIGVEIDNLNEYHDGFSFTVKTELDAYKAAHKYQGPAIDRTVVRPAPNVGGWSVHIYRKPAVTEYVRPFGNKLIDVPGYSRDLIKTAADRLMPPQYEQFCKALRGECPPATNQYWQNIAGMWDEQLENEKSV